MTHTRHPTFCWAPRSSVLFLMFWLAGASGQALTPPWGQCYYTHHRCASPCCHGRLCPVLLQGACLSGAGLNGNCILASRGLMGPHVLAALLNCRPAPLKALPLEAGHASLLCGCSRSRGSKMILSRLLAHESVNADFGRKPRFR